MKNDGPHLLGEGRSFAIKCLLVALFVAIVVTAIPLLYLVPLLIQQKLTPRGELLLVIDVMICVGASLLRWRITGRAPWA